MPGLINLTLNPTERNVLAPGKIAQAGATGYDASLGVVNLDTDSVSGQLEKILSKDSPVMTRARAGAMQSANSRGLLNSSMAAGAGEAAVIDAALPIAQQDANTFSQQRLANQQVSNAADQFGADAANRTVALNTGEANQLGRLKEQGITETGLQTLRGTQSKELAQLEQANRQILQSSDSAARFFSQTSASISDILKEPGISVEAKQQLVQKQVDLLKNGLAVIGGINNLDLTGLLKFDSLTGGTPAP